MTCLFNMNYCDHLGNYRTRQFSPIAFDFLSPLPAMDVPLSSLIAGLPDVIARYDTERATDRALRDEIQARCKANQAKRKYAKKGNA